MQVVVNDLLVNYERKGKGRTVILLHGWADSLIGLTPLFNDLSKDFDVISIDLPGFGASQTPDNAWGLEDYGNFLASFKSKIGIKNTHALVGHSNGGAIAIKALANNIVDAKKLVLLASSGIRGDQKGRLTVLKLVTGAAKIAAYPLPSSTKNKLRRKLYSSIGSDLLAAENMSESFKKIVKEDLKPDAKKLSLPTLLIYGEEDDVTPVTYGETYHQLIDGSTLEVVGGAGHFLLIDKQETVVKLVRDFLC